jgi:hypothetical protein
VKRQPEASRGGREQIRRRLECGVGINAEVLAPSDAQRKHNWVQNLTDHGQKTEVSESTEEVVTQVLAPVLASARRVYHKVVR